MRPSACLLLALALFAAPGQAAEIDYLPLVEADAVKALIGQYGLSSWREPSYDSAASFRRVRSGLVELVERRLYKDGRPPSVPLARLPEPSLNRMALNLLRRKGGLLKTPGEELAFMAKVLLDSKTVLWTELGGAANTELGEATAQPPGKGPPYKMNCAQFVAYAAFKAGFPADATREKPSYDLAKIGAAKLQMLDTSPLGDWRAWWRPGAAPSGEVYSYEAVTMMPGDLLLIFKQDKVKTSLLEARQPASYQFFHVEMIVETDNYDSARTISIGNSEKEPHFSNLLGRYSKLMNWLDENYPNFYYETINDWQVVVYKLRLDKELPAVLTVP